MWLLDPGTTEQNLPTPLAIIHNDIHYFSAVYSNTKLGTDGTTSWISSHYLRLHLALVQYTSCLPIEIIFFISYISSNLRATSPTQLLFCNLIAQNHKVTYKLWFSVWRNILHYPPTSYFFLFLGGGANTAVQHIYIYIQTQMFNTGRLLLVW